MKSIAVPVQPRAKRALGQCAGFPAGHRDGHQLVNCGDALDVAQYPDVDLWWNAPAAPDVYTHQGGRPS